MTREKLCVRAPLDNWQETRRNGLGHGKSFEWWLQNLHQWCRIINPMQLQEKAKGLRA